MRVILNSLAWFQRAAMETERLQKLRARLTIHPHGWDATTKEPLYLFQEVGGAIGVPRSFYLQYKTGQDSVEDRTTLGDRATWLADPVAFQGTLREDQTQALRNVLAAYRAGITGGLIRARGGFGKTVVAASLIATLRLPTLIGVHTEFLLTQWEKRLHTYLPGVRVGRVQEDVEMLQGAHVVLAMLPTLAARTSARVDAWPGLFVVDEAHHLGARTWANLPARFPARYRLGLTATPRRSDGAAGAFRWHLGQDLYENIEPDLIPQIRYVYTTFAVRHLSADQLRGRDTVISALVQDQDRNDTIFDQLVAAIQAKRRIILLSERRAHLDYFLHRIRGSWPGEESPTCALFVGGLTQAQQERASEAQVILATSQLLREALDIPELDTLFLATPMSDVEQAVYRILRPHPQKQPPIVVDFRDPNTRTFLPAARTRDACYYRLGAHGS